MADEEDAWVPLEANPDVMNEYARRLGVPDAWGFVDVLGLDEEALMWVPRPALAVLLLYPCDGEDENNASNVNDNNKAFFVRQCVRNACGTIALVHAIANNMAALGVGAGAFERYVAENADATPEERGARLGKCAAIVDAHRELAEAGQSERGADVDHHFVALVHRDGRLLELDGRKAAPVDRGPTDADNFLTDAAAVCRGFVASRNDDVRFNVIALASNQ